MKQPPAPAPITPPTITRRMSCWLYEGMLLFGVLFFAGYIFSIITQTRHALSHRHEHQLVLFLVLGFYFVWFWTRDKGQTLAMKTWHIRVIDKNGMPLTRARAALRYLLCWLWILPPLAILGLAPHWQDTKGLASLFSLSWVVFWALLARMLPERQFLHDILAGTRLIYQAPPPRAEKNRKWWQL